MNLGFNQILLFSGLIFATFLFSKVFNIIITKFIEKQSERIETDFNAEILKAFKSPASLLIYLFGSYLALMVLSPINKSIQLKSLITALTETSVTLIITWLCFRLVDVFEQFLVQHLNDQQSNDKESLLLHFFPLIKRSLKITVFVIAFIIIIQDRGYSVTSLLTGLGITGLAVGFAAKESIANIFGSFSLIIDHTYKVGDWIIVDKNINGNAAEGIVEDVTLRSTKIRAFDDTLIIIPNNEMANSTIKNVSKHRKRRILESINLAYSTSPEQVEQAIEICRQITLTHPMIEENQQIYLNQFGENSLKITFCMFTSTTEWSEYLNIRHEIFFAIIKEFKKNGIEFAAPMPFSSINKN